MFSDSFFWIFNCQIYFPIYFIKIKFIILIIISIIMNYLFLILNRLLNNLIQLLKLLLSLINRLKLLLLKWLLLLKLLKLQLLRLWYDLGCVNWLLLLLLWSDKNLRLLNLLLLRLSYIIWLKCSNIRWIITVDNLTLTTNRWLTKLLVIVYWLYSWQRLRILRKIYILLKFFITNWTLI